jgi:hypothetical protein
VRAFIGVLFTGKMNAAVVESALDVLLPEDCGAGIEILFHPGESYPSELAIWQKNDMLKAYYSHPDRASERKALLDNRLHHAIEKFKSHGQAL